MAERATTLNREAAVVRERLLVTGRRWESARPTIGRALSRRRTRVSDLRGNRQVRSAEPATLFATDLPSLRHRHRVRIRTRGR